MGEDWEATTKTGVTQNPLQYSQMTLGCASIKATSRSYRGISAAEGSRFHFLCHSLPYVFLCVVCTQLRPLHFLPCKTDSWPALAWLWDATILHLFSAAQQGQVLQCSPEVEVDGVARPSPVSTLFTLMYMLIICQQNALGGRVAAVTCEPQSNKTHPMSPLDFKTTCSKIAGHYE